MSLDRYLRRWGFAIASRPGSSEPSWTDRKTGRVCFESVALRIAQEREAREAERVKKAG